MIRLVLLSTLFVAFVVAQNSNDPNFIVLPVIIRDFFPCGTSEWVSPPPNGLTSQMVMANCNPDIEPHQFSQSGWGWGMSTAEKGLVQSTLGSNRKPVWALPDAPNGITTFQYQSGSAANFSRWWDSSWPGAYTIKFNLTLELNPTSGLYVIANNSFFPLDNQGWGNNGYGEFSNHNWGFCVEAHAAFIYNSSAVLSFEGDDDLWIFMNNQLVFDIGGIHTAVPQTTKLGDFNWATPMTEFASYPFDMFYCERQTFLSDIILTSTVNIYCPNNQYDACGVCQGHGSCCPDQCVPKDACTIGKLNPMDCTCSYDSTTKYQKCAAQSTACTSVQCDGSANNNTGKCTSSPIQGPSYNGCQQQSCDLVNGFKTVDYNPCPQNANATCYPNTCVPSGSSHSCSNSTVNQCQGACQNFPCPSQPCSSVTCTNNPSGVNSAAGRTCNYISSVPTNTTCTGFTCAANNTVISTPLLVCTNSSNLCYTSYCDNAVGGCSKRVFTDCNDNNNCTTEFCVESTGKCQYNTIPLPSANNTCIVASCDPVFGVTATNISCKGIRCTQDPTKAGCCQCQGIPLAAIILGAGAIAGIAIGGTAAAAIVAVGGKVGYDYFAAHGAAAQGVQDNPLYVGNQSGGNNVMYDASA